MCCFTSFLDLGDDGMTLEVHFSNLFNGLVDFREYIKYNHLSSPTFMTKNLLSVLVK